jgi:uncharacterized glyoxalase superfamily protein PhnB
VTQAAVRFCSDGSGEFAERGRDAPAGSCVASEFVVAAPDVLHQRVAFARWGNLVIHLAHDDHPEAHMTSTIYLHVDDADELAADWREAGMEVIGPENQDYGKLEGQHIDPDGNLIRFGGPPRT